MVPVYVAPDGLILAVTAVLGAIIGSFLNGLAPGTRNFCLVHPQRWGRRVHPSYNPLLEEQAWHREMLAKYAATHSIETIAE